jgi:hypothetical protein
LRRGELAAYLAKLEAHQKALERLALRMGLAIKRDVTVIVWLRPTGEKLFETFTVGADGKPESARSRRTRGQD